MIIRTARTYIGVNFHWHGRSEAGLDCLGLILRVLWDCGYTPPDFHDYGNNPVGTIVKTLGKQSCKRISPAFIMAGDMIVLFEDQHMGFYANDQGYETVIHCSVRRGVTENHLDRKDLSAVFRWVDPLR